MAAITEAEQISHEIRRATTYAISWTGAVQALFSLLTLVWTVVWAVKAKKEENKRLKKEEEEKREKQETWEEREEKRRKQAEEKDERRRRAANLEDSDRRKKVDKKYERRWERMERVVCRTELVVLRREVHQVQVDRAELEVKHQADLEMKELLIESLEWELVREKRRRRFPPDWAPGDLEAESSVTGG